MDSRKVGMEMGVYAGVYSGPYYRPDLGSMSFGLTSNTQIPSSRGH